MITRPLADSRARRAITRGPEPLPRIFVFCPDWIRGGGMHGAAGRGFYVFQMYKKESRE